MFEKTKCVLVALASVSIVFTGIDITLARHLVRKHCETSGCFARYVVSRTCQ